METKDEVTGRIGVHKTALIFLEQMRWIEREQFISDYGIDMHVEIVDNGIPTGLLIALQIKSGQSYLNRNENKITYYGKMKHLDYWLYHSLPVIIVIYDDIKDVAYWEFVNQKTVVLTDNAWKIDISTENILNGKSENKIKDTTIPHLHNAT